MKRWVQVLLGAVVAALLLQYALYVRGSTFRAQFLDVPMPANSSQLLRTLSGTPVAPRHNVSHVLLAGTNVSTTPLTHRPNVSSDPHRHHPYRFVLNQPTACTNSTELVMVVITAVKNFLDRQAVRETWGSYVSDVSHKTSMVFLVGTASSRQLQARLVNESELYRDIVQEDFVDSYRNLSLKSVALLKWVITYCPTARFVLKADDDMYVNVPNLISAMRKEYSSRVTFVMGHVFTGAKPLQNKNSKWYTPLEEFNENVYPRYASGTAYAMTGSAAKLLYQASAQVPVFWLEDIYVTGLCSRKAGVPVVHNWRFSYQKQTDPNKKSSGCHFRKAITGHRYTAAEKRRIHKLVYDPNLLCK